jgi:uncharacterized protein (TIGR03000 family)
MNGVALMVALIAAPDAISFGRFGCGCDGLFNGRIRAFFQAKLHGGLLARCRHRHAVWTPPVASGCGCGGYDVGGMPPMGPVPYGYGPFPAGPYPGYGVPMHGGPVPMPVGAAPTQAPSGPTASTVWGVPPSGDAGPTPPVLGSPTPLPTTTTGTQPAPVPAPIPSGARVPAAFPLIPPTVPVAGVKPAHAVGGEDFAPARMVFNVPAGAVVYVDGQPVAGSGPVRRFHTPSLPRGRTFFYEFRAEVEVNGLKMVEEKVIPVCAGDELGETFAKLTAAATK